MPHLSWPSFSFHIGHEVPHIADHKGLEEVSLDNHVVQAMLAHYIMMSVIAVHLMSHRSEI